MNNVFMKERINDWLNKCITEGSIGELTNWLSEFDYTNDLLKHINEYFKCNPCHESFSIFKR